jgi:nitrogen fixation protein FixH
MVPTLAYMIYATLQWPGLDVVTMHVVAYPTVALMFGLLYGAKANHDANMHWVPKILIGFFIVLTFIMGAFVYIARQGLPPRLAAMLLPDTRGALIHTGFAGVVEHNQEAANSIAHHLNMQNKLSRHGWQLEVNGLNEVRSGVDTPITILISDRETRPVENLNVNLELHHPGQSGDIKLPLTGGLGSYHGTVPSLEAGHWVAHITLVDGTNDAIDLEHDVEVR